MVKLALVAAMVSGGAYKPFIARPALRLIVVRAMLRS